MEKCFLVHINIGGKPSKARIADAARQLKSIIDSISPDNQLAYTSGDGSAFGFFIKSTLSAGQVAHRVNSPGGSAETGNLTASPILHDDSALILEIGEDVSGIGKSRVQAWFQHHRPTRATRPQDVSAGNKFPSQLSDQLAKLKKNPS